MKNYDELFDLLYLLHMEEYKRKAKTKNGKNIPSLEVVEVVLVQCNLIHNHYQQNPEVLYTFTPNKSYAYLLNIEPSNLMFFKTYNTEFDDINIISMGQNGSLLVIEDEFDLSLLINKSKCHVIL